MNSISSVIGPYVVESTLGTGGMGVVYRARHAASGARVALKTLRARSPEMLALFRREIHVLAHLHHPGVVKIVDHGLARGVPWYAMELVEGTTMSSFVRHGGPSAGVDRDLVVTPSTAPVSSVSPRAADGSRLAKGRSAIVVPLRDMIPLFRHISRTLAFLHERGIVHRDLKPDNILIQPDRTPVLVDFGIVAQFGGGAGREVLDVPGAAQGTLAYMAPEQRWGRLVDARADLFSLGCIIYECISGVLPFGLAGLYSSSAARPRPPSAYVPDISPELDAVVMRLLAENPQDRLGYAEDLDAVLESVESGRSAGRPSRPPGYVYRPAFTGRGEVMRRLDRGLEDALSGRGVMALITGESGVGKTRLLIELASIAAQKGMAVVTGDCPPVGPRDNAGVALGAPLHPFRGLLAAVADACRAGGAAATERLLGEHGRVLAAHDPAIRELVGNSAELEPLPPDAARARLLAGLAGLLLDFARERPLLLAIDDLQWADDLSIELLTSMLSRDWGSAPVAIVGTCRIEEMSERLRAISADARILNESLARFDREGVREMVSGMLAMRPPPAELVDFVYEESDGNAFFAAEYLRAAIAGQLLNRDSAGRWILPAATESDDLREHVELPSAVGALIERRLQGLDPTAVETVFSAAVLGRGFQVDLVASTADLAVDAVLNAYGTLRQRQILEEDGAGSTRFVHDKLREFVYAQIDRERLPRLHARAAAAMAARYPAGELDSHLGAIAYHYAKAGDRPQAAEYFERAADHARRNYANRDAVQFYRLALDQLEPAGQDGPEQVEARCRIREALGDLLLVGGEAPEARAEIEIALRDTPSRARLERVRRRRKLARTWERQHRHADALAVYALAEAELGDEPGDADPEREWWHEHVQIQVDQAWDLYWLTRVEELATLVERVRPFVERYGTPAQRAQFFQALAHMNLRRDGYGVADDTIEYARALLAAAHEAGDLRELSLGRFLLAFLLMYRGLEREAEPHFVEALAGSERIGDATLQTRFLCYYGILHRRLGRIEEARAAAVRAASLAEKTRQFDYVGASKAHLCWAAWRLGERDETVRQATEAFGAWSRLPPEYPYPFQWFVRMPWGAHLAEEGRYDEAFEHWEFLLGDGQQRLPEPLREAIQEARVKQAEAPAPVDRAPAAHRIIGLAREFRYL